MAVTKNIVKRNFFRDSVQMMLLSDQLKKEPGVINAAIIMGTELNKNTHNVVVFLQSMEIKLAKQIL